MLLLGEYQKYYEGMYCKWHFSKTYPSFLTLKEGSTSHPGPLSSGAREKTALRRSEPLRYKVGGPSKVFAKLCGMGPPWVTLLFTMLIIGFLKLWN